MKIAKLYIVVPKYLPTTKALQYPFLKMETIEKHSLHTAFNGNGLQLISFTASRSSVIMSTYFRTTELIMKPPKWKLQKPDRPDNIVYTPHASNILEQ